MEPTQMNRVTFTNAIENWLTIAEKHNEKAVISNIRKVATESFAAGRKELDSKGLAPGMNAITVKHAKANYHAAFLVATNGLQKLVNKWEKESSFEQRSALLLAVISSDKISDKELYQFLVSIKVKVDGGWFEYGGKNTELYNAFVKNRSYTPKELVEKYEGTVKVLHPQDPKGKEKVASTITTTTTTIPKQHAATTTTTTVQAAPVSKVQAAAAKQANLETFFVALYGKEGKASPERLSMHQLVDYIDKKDFEAVRLEISRYIKEKVKEEEEFIIEKSKDGGCKIISESNWYNSSRCALLFEIQVNKGASSGSSIYTKKSHPLLNNLIPESLSIVQLELNEVAGLSVSSMPRNNCWVVANKALLEDVMGQMDKKVAYCYQDTSGVKVLLIHEDGYKEVVDFSKIDLGPNSREVLEKIRFPSEGKENANIPDFRSLISFASNEKITSSFELLSFYFKVTSALSLAKESDSYDQAVAKILQESITYIQTKRTGVNEEGEETGFLPKPILADRLEEVLVDQLPIIDATNATLLLAGMLDKNSPLSKLPKEMIFEIIQTSLALEQKRVQDMKKALKTF